MTAAVRQTARKAHPKIGKFRNSKEIMEYLATIFSTANSVLFDKKLNFIFILRAFVSSRRNFYESLKPLEASEKADEQQRDHYQEKSNK